MPSSAKSYQRINYALRPAKAIERKMLADAFQRLAAFCPLPSYRYVGFGSAYFADFSLFHKNLGIHNMLSIERDIQNKARFVFNRPYACIDIDFRNSTSVLATLDWDMKTIMWLDYDGPLTPSVLEDVELFVNNAAPGSALVVTVNAQPPRAPESRLEYVRNLLGDDLIPPELQEKDLRQWGLAKFFRRVITNQILETLRNRNARPGRRPKIFYKQLFNFHYADGPNMLTAGGILYDEGQKQLASTSVFADLPYVRMTLDLDRDNAYLIEVPQLTYRELRFLDRQLPCHKRRKLRGEAIPQEDLERYKRLYRYFPNFAEMDV